MALRSRIALVLAGALVVPSPCAAAAALSWPTVALPSDAVVYPVADQMAVHGIPLRIQGFFVKSTLGATANWFRERLGKPIVENRLGRALVLGRAQGPHFITIQLSSQADGTSGTLSIAHLHAAYKTRDTRKTATERLLSRLPPGSELVTELVSNDGNKQSRFYVVSNTYHEEVNRDHVHDLMREDGLTVRHQASAPNPSTAGGKPQLSNGIVYVFNGERKEAVAVIGRNAIGRTIVQVNVISDVAYHR